MRTILTLLIAIFFTSCGPSAEEIDKELAKYIEYDAVIHDSVIYYTISGNRLTLSFPREPELKNWLIAVNDYNVQSYTVIDKKITIEDLRFNSFTDSTAISLFTLPDNSWTYLDQGQADSYKFVYNNYKTPGKLHLFRHFKNMVRVDMIAMYEIKDPDILQAFKDTVKKIYGKR